VRVEYDASALAEGADLSERTLQMWARFDVNAEDICARLGKGFEIAFGLDDHQVNIHGHFRGGAHRAHEGRPACDIWRKSAIEHVDVNPISAGTDSRLYFLGQPPEIRAEN
jgi:hypothetical protein